MDFPDLVYKELVFWFKNLGRLNRKCLLNYTLHSILIYSDASNVAAGAFMVELNQSVFHQMWKTDESTMSSMAGNQSHSFSIV